MFATDCHLDTLRRRLALPPAALQADAMSFVLKGHSPVVVFKDTAQRLRLVAELALAAPLSAADWCRLVTLLSAHFEDAEMGRLLLLDGRLAMGWSHEGMTPQVWSEQVLRTLAWWQRLRLAWVHAGTEH